MTQSSPVVTQTAGSNQGTDKKKQGIKDKYKMTRLMCILLTILSSTILLLLLLLISLMATQCLRTHHFCPDDWIGFQKKCYYFSKEEGDWNSSRHDCITRGADLTIIDTTKEMDFLKRYKCTADHWIGLEITENQTLQWVNGTMSKIWFPVRGNEKCAYLDNDGAATARCYTDRKWICRMQMH
ncbi:c-type lectin domain family 2 [Lynx pardinus]|uniref:C-type lectin domain family 2 n=1 Tax=Lynx pardinus TaxID=191816 RepID=A0A485P3R0_LYNPA|nr:c-type lectin domain family 2 [Lynx pardinus]